VIKLKIIKKIIRQQCFKIVNKSFEKRMGSNCEIRKEIKRNKKKSFLLSENSFERRNTFGRCLEIEG
jgi:hypothetical protein